MKKKLLSIILAVFMVMTLLPVSVFADETYTITMDIGDGELTNGDPNGWEDIGNGKYTKAFPASQWANFGDEWNDYKPVKDGFVFGGWLPDGSYYTTDSVFLRENTNVSAQYLEILDVVIDLDGGAIDDADIPVGWTLIAEQTDQYTKKYAEETSYYEIIEEWQNVVPQYENRVFIEWNNPNSYSLAKGDQPIIAVAGELKPVTVDFDGGVVLSADSSWTLVTDTTDKYTKMFPEGYSTWTINYELQTAFSVQSFNETKFFAKSYSCSKSTVSGDDTVFNAEYIPAITITITPPENGSIFVGGEEKTSPYDLKVPEGVNCQEVSGILKLSKYLIIDDIFIEAYGNPGYAINKYTLNGTEITSYIPSIASGSIISATFTEGTQTYPIWVAGTQLSSDNLSIFDDTVSYNPTTKVLTLDGANIVSDYPAAIYFGTDITINVASDSTITTSDKETTRCVLAGVAGKNNPSDTYWNSYFSYLQDANNLTITGDGKLTVKLAEKTISYTINATGIFAKNVVINTDVDVICDDLITTSNFSIDFYGLSSNNISVNDAKLSVTSKTINDGGGGMRCIMINGPISLNNAELKLTMGQNTSGIGYETSEFIGGNEKILLVQVELKLAHALLEK